MKLLQLSAKEVTAWPEFAEWLVQSENTGEIIFDADGGCATTADFKAQEIADDADYVVVTRAQWEAERARIAGKEHFDAWSHGLHSALITGDSMKDSEKRNKEEHAEIMRHIFGEAENRAAQYEQELWDKVARELFVKFSIEFETDTESRDTAVNAMDGADAFMAERAKRLKK